MNIIRCDNNNNNFNISKCSIQTHLIVLIGPDIMEFELLIHSINEGLVLQVTIRDDQIVNRQVLEVVVSIYIQSFGLHSADLDY